MLKETRPYLLMVYEKKKKKIQNLNILCSLASQANFCHYRTLFYYENVKPTLFHTRKMHGDLWVSS